MLLFLRDIYGCETRYVFLFFFSSPPHTAYWEPAGLENGRHEERGLEKGWWAEVEETAGSHLPWESFHEGVINAATSTLQHTQALTRTPQRQWGERGKRRGEKRKCKKASEGERESKRKGQSSILVLYRSHMHSKSLWKSMFPYKGISQERQLCANIEWRNFFVQNMSKNIACA